LSHSKIKVFVKDKQLDHQSTLNALKEKYSNLNSETLSAEEYFDYSSIDDTEDIIDDYQEGVEEDD